MRHLAQNIAEPDRGKKAVLHDFYALCEPCSPGAPTCCCSLADVGRSTVDGTGTCALDTTHRPQRNTSRRFRMILYPPEGLVAWCESAAYSVPV